MKKVVLFSLIALLGCQRTVRTAEVSKANLDVPEVSFFPQSAIEEGHLKWPNVKMFMWRPGLRNGEMSPVLAEDIVLASEVARETGKLDAEATQLGKRMEALKPSKEERQNNKKKEIKKGIPALVKGIEKLNQEINERTQRIQKLNVDLEATRSELADQEKKEQPDPTKIEELKALLATQEATLKSESDNQAAAETKKSEDLGKVAVLEEELRLELGLTVPYRQYMGELEAKIQAEETEINRWAKDLSDRGNAQVEKLVSRVDYFENPPQYIDVDFNQAGAGVASVTLKMWDPMDGRKARTFTTLKKEDGLYTADEEENVEWESVRSVSYQARGQRISFFVDTDRGTTFEFTFARVDERDPRGRILMSGDIFRHRKGELTRMGVIKLSTAKN